MLSDLAAVTNGTTVCATFALCSALIKQGKSVAYEGHAGALRLDAAGEPTGAREVVGMFLHGSLVQVRALDVKVPSAT
jgi:hypothetical protein